LRRIWSELDQLNLPEEKNIATFTDENKRLERIVFWLEKSERGKK
jgi:hypothetical protein